MRFSCALALLVQLVGLADVARANGRFDAGAGLGGRTVPLGASIFAHGGYGAVLWGDASKGVLYGFLRPWARLQTSGAVSCGELAFDVFPVSFVGLTGGHVEMWSLVDVRTIDCQIHSCRGFYRSNYLRAKGLAGLASFFAVANLQVDWLSADAKDRPFADQYSALAGRAGSDRLLAFDFLGGFGFGGDDRARAWRIGAYVAAQHMSESGANNDLEVVFAQRRLGDWSVMAGGGAYRSSTVDRGPTFFAILRWTARESIGLD